MTFALQQNGCGFQQGGTSTTTLDVAKEDVKQGACTTSWSLQWNYVLDQFCMSIGVGFNKQGMDLKVF